MTDKGSSAEQMRARSATLTAEDLASPERIAALERKVVELKKEEGEPTAALRDAVGALVCAKWLASLFE